ncbi:MAG TPA: glycosyltransferase family 39 protein [Patescibacteria group bacterium]|nr:glycosyltransferase family 39 protein [Patescibacteria group bacterium]
MKTRLLLFGILIIAVLLRFLFLDKVPTGIFNDELTYLLVSKSIVLTGRDITGLWSPLSVFFFHYPQGALQTGLIQAELPYLLFLPAIGIFGLTMFGVHVTNAVAGVCLVIVIYLLTKKLFDKNVALIAAFFTAINPWFIVSSRTSYESIYAVLFYLLGIYILFIAKRWYILLSFPVFLLAFYSYIGTKLIFLPLIFFSCLYVYLVTNHKKYLLQYIILNLAAVVLIVLFLFAQVHSSTRLSEVLTINNPVISQQVDAIRKTSVANPFIPVFTNKATIFMTILITKTFKIFSFDYLFVSGDSFFAMWRHGLFYVIDAIFLLIGFASMYVKRKKIFWWFFALIGISILPQLFYSASVDNFTPHIAFLIPLFLIIMAFGLWQVLTLSIIKKYRNYFMAAIVFIYLIFTLNFFVMYIFQNSMVGNFYDFPSRTLSLYLQGIQSKSGKVIVYTGSPQILFRKYLFYSDGLTISSINTVRKEIAAGSRTFSLNNVQFQYCPDVMIPLQKGVTVIYDVGCNLNQNDNNHLNVVQLPDDGPVYKIYNDSLCSDFSLHRFPSNIDLSYFAPEKYSTKDFCEKYILKVK